LHWVELLARLPEKKTRGTHISATNADHTIAAEAKGHGSRLW
jgi:hypothetical protein